MSIDLKIEQAKVSDLLPYKNNAKLHDEKQIGQIVDSIREFGFNDPIGIDEENSEIIEGHARYEAAKVLGLEVVPVIKLGHLSEAQKRAYRIAHNKTTMNTGFDNEALVLEFDYLKDINFDLTLTGFDLDDWELDIPFGEEIPDDTTPLDRGADSEQGRFILVYTTKSEMEAICEKLDIAGDKVVYTAEELNIKDGI